MKISMVYDICKKNCGGYKYRYKIWGLARSGLIADAEPYVHEMVKTVCKKMPVTFREEDINDTVRHFMKYLAREAKKRG